MNRQRLLIKIMKIIRSVLSYTSVIIAVEFAIIGQRQLLVDFAGLLKVFFFNCFLIFLVIDDWPVPSGHYIQEDEIGYCFDCFFLSMLNDEESMIGQEQTFVDDVSDGIV